MLHIKNISSHVFEIGDYVKLNDDGILCSHNNKKKFKEHQMGEIVHHISNDSGNKIYEIITENGWKETWYDYHLKHV